MEQVKRMQMLVLDGSARKRIQGALGEEYVGELVKYIDHSLNGTSVEGWAETFGRFVHGRVIFGTYALNVVSWAKQLVSFAGAVGHPNVGPVAMAEAMNRIIRDPKGAMEFASRMDSAMRHRMHNTEADENVVSTDITTPRSKVTKGFDKFTESAVKPMRWAQYWGGDLPTWTAAYLKAEANLKIAARSNPNLDIRQEAAKIANQTLIETQGSAYNAEQAAINRTVYGKIFTFALKWTINNFNTLYRMHKSKTTTKGQALKYFVTSAIVGSILMRTVGAVLQVTKPDDEEKKEKEGTKQFLSDVSLDVLGSAHFVLPRIIDSVSDGIPSFGPASRAGFGGLAKASTEVRQYFDDNPQTEAEFHKFLAGVLSTSSTLVPIPNVEANRIIKAFGSDDYDDAYEMWAAAITGSEYYGP